VLAAEVLKGAAPIIEAENETDSPVKPGLKNSYFYPRAEGRDRFKKLNSEKINPLGTGNFQFSGLIPDDAYFH
jgi:hypothetical protein